MIGRKTSVLQVPPVYPYKALGARVFRAVIREFKHDVYGRRQTAKMTSEFVFISSNP